MPTTITMESQGEFIERNGKNPLPLDDSTGWMILPNGAKYNPRYPGYKRQEAPTDKLGKLEGRLTYQARLYEHLKKQSLSMMQYIHDQARNYVAGAGPSPSEEDLAELERLMKDMNKATTMRDALAGELRRLRGPDPMEIQAARREERKAEMNLFLEKVKNISQVDYRAIQQQVEEQFLQDLKEEAAIFDGLSDLIAAKHGMPVLSTATKEDRNDPA